MNKIIINATSNKKALARFGEIDSFKSFHIRVYYTGELYDYYNFNDYRIKRDLLKSNYVIFDSWGFYKSNGLKTIFTMQVPETLCAIQPLQVEINLCKKYYQANCEN